MTKQQQLLLTLTLSRSAIVKSRRCECFVASKAFIFVVFRSRCCVAHNVDSLSFASLSQILLFPYRYGYFKIVSTSSAIPTHSRPGVFSLEKRAKWDAWKAAGETLPSDVSDIAEAAKLRYTNVVRAAMGADELDSLS